MHALIDAPSQQLGKAEREPRTDLPPVTLAEALVDPDPLIRFQATRQLAFENGDAVLPDDAGITVERLIELWQRNRNRMRDHRLRTGS